VKKNKKKLEVAIMLRDFDRDPNEISKILELEPTNVIRKGEKRSGQKRDALVNLWEFTSDLDDNISVETHVIYLLQKVRKWNVLDNVVPLSGRYIQILLNLVPGDTDPLLALSNDTLKRLADSRLSLDVDMYVWNKY